MQELGGHDDKEKEPAGHTLQLETANAPTEEEDVPEGQGKQACVPLMYVPATQAFEQEEDPATE
jgi:hypothetical protein